MGFETKSDSVGLDNVLRSVFSPLLRLLNAGLLAGLNH